MKTSFSLAALTVAVAVGAVFAQGFNVRTGTWLYSVTIKGAMPMEGIPPEAQAAIAAQLSKPQTTTSCLTAEDLKQLNLGRMEEDDDEDCKVVSQSMTPTSADITRECTGDSTYIETAHFEAPTPQTMSGNVSRKSAQGTMTMAISGKWVAAQCKE